ncbi:meiotic nuclear division protein 1 [Morchella conica CCBAS932]|uniref:Meiotic nuclear division protein 1 n=1 Tax=Morchella conica CCBAS932 TaxID=1392247 RepID=A0A3N4KTP5_9PEZI|nr:meiotic nuclear division protein 1 [Morchella conica CCBAS932]
MEAKGPEPPKTLPPPAKLNLILTHFHTTLTTHPLKDLEKSLPSAAGISPMVVKDFLTALTDEGLLRVEKIGSGNWYWSFPSDAKHAKARLLAQFEKELEKLEKNMEEVRAELESVGLQGEEVRERAAMAERVQALTAVKAALVEEWGRCDPEVEGRRRSEMKRMREEINMYNDNLYTLESYVKEATGGDREKMDACRKMFGMEDDLEYV